jgi:hypothetical protein
MLTILARWCHKAQVKKEKRKQVLKTLLARLKRLLESPIVLHIQHSLTIAVERL